MRSRKGSAYNFEAIYLKGVNITALIAQSISESLKDYTPGVDPVATVNSTQIVTERYVAKTNGAGYSDNDILRRTEFFNLAVTPVTSTSSWYNFTKGAALSVAPVMTELELQESNSLTDQQLRAAPLSFVSDAFGTVDAAPAPQAGGGNYAMIPALKRIVITLFDIYNRLDTINQKITDTSYNNSVVRCDFYDAKLGGSGFAAGDVLQRLEIYQTTKDANGAIATPTLSVVWRNFTLNTALTVIPSASAVIMRGGPTGKERVLIKDLVAGNALSGRQLAALVAGRLSAVAISQKTGTGEVSDSLGNTVVLDEGDSLNWSSQGGTKLDTLSVLFGVECVTGKMRLVVTYLGDVAEVDSPIGALSSGSGALLTDSAGNVLTQSV
jgi:hypothetical protein